MNMYKLIIFDLDGTLIQNPFFYKTIYSQSLTDLVRDLKGEKGLAILAYCRENFDGRGELALPILGIPYFLWAERLEKLPLNLIKKNSLLVETIKSIPAKKVIYSGSPLVLAKRLLRKTGFSLLEFEEIIGWEKSEEFPLKWSCSSFVFDSLMKKYKTLPNSTLSIGDNDSTDLLPAEKIGIPKIYINSSSSTLSIIVSELSNHRSTRL